MNFDAGRGTSALVPEVPGVLTAEEVYASGRAIAAAQRADGMIPWFAGGHADPWNHVEATMALTLCGFLAEAEAAFDWLAARQLPDGSWFNYYLAHGVKDSRIDTNVCAYVATGLWHHALVTGKYDLLARHWPMVERAIDFVLRWQRPDGSVRWSLDQAGRPESYALLTGSSSIFHSLRCAVAAAEALDRPRPGWELAAGRLGHAVARHPRAFTPKDEFAMDWYYPVLSGAITGDAACLRLERTWMTFVLDGSGVRCVSGNDWVTAAETAECAIALSAAGKERSALELLGWGQGLRLADGSYWTGMVYPDEMTFPGGERTTYTAAAMVLAADALSAAIDLAAPFCTGDASCIAAAGARLEPDSSASSLTGTDRHGAR
ncbi:MAG: prenyltransferase [Acidimicrobiales bacterium]